MNWLTRAAVDRRSVTLLIAAALFAFGVAAWGSLKQELLPDVSFPVATVIAPYPGAAADDVADQVVAPIERAVQSVAGIDQVRSTSANSIGFVTAQFEYGTDVDEATAAMEEAIAALTLPESVEPDVSALNINASPVVIAAISSESASLSELGEIAADEIVPELEGIAGVADVEITGGLEDEVTVTLDPVALAQSGVGYAQVQGALAASGITIPAGELPSESTSIPVTVIGEITSTEELEAIVVGVSQVSTGTPTPVTLGDVASIESAERATTGYARINGKEALALTVSKTASANTVEVSEAVNAALDEILDRTDLDIEIDRVSEQADFIIESRDGLLREGGLGALFAVLTIFAFLGSFRSTFVAAMSIPLSLLVALVLMQVTGITMNIMTLGGLAVAVGRVVDDSIVVLENIYRHRAVGDDRRTAVLKGPAEVAGAITWSTLTTVAVFLPLGFAGGLISQFFLPFALTVTFALLASLLVALTVVPVLGYFLVNRPSGAMDEAGEPKRSIWVRLYDPTIRAVLRTRWTSIATVVGALALFIGSLFLVPLLPTAFINSGSEKILVVAVSPPPGSTSEAVRDVAAEAEAIILADDEVELVQTSVPPEGDTGFRTLISAQAGRAANSATMFVRLDQESDLPEAATRLEESLGAIETDGWNAIVQQNTGPAAGGNLAVVVGGPDADAVEAGTESVVDAVGAIDGLANVTSDLVAAAPMVEVRVDAERAAAAGVSAGQVGGVVRAVLTPASVTTIQPDGGGEPVAVLLRFDPSAIDSSEALAQLPVGQGATLGDVADIEEREVRATISRVNATPSATVSAEITSDDTGGVSAAVNAELDRLESSGELPAGVTVAIGGVSEQQAEAFGGLFTAMAVAILLVYLMLALAFGSLITPFIILFSLPLATIGAFPALLITGRPIGISALIGFLMLIGIVVTNAIVLLDLVERHRAEGMPVREALIRGGHTRVRPILMTAIATILALVPLAAGFNEGSIIAAELGTVVIGGLLSSTFLTLLVVPAAYRLVEGLRARMGRAGPRDTVELQPEATGR